jgi:hypothetical protein
VKIPVILILCREEEEDSPERPMDSRRSHRDKHDIFKNYFTF